MELKKIKPRIIQIESIYSGFAQSLYSQLPALAGQSFNRQIEYILSSGWSAGQNVVPHLDPSRWARGYIIPKLLPTQKAWAIENGFFENDPKQINLRDILASQIKKFRPNAIYISDIGSFDFSILDELDFTPILVAWLASRVPKDIPWHRIDLLLSGISAIRKETLALGVKKAKNFNSAAPGFLRPSQFSEKYEYLRPSVAFSGSFFPNFHDQRAQMFVKVASKVADIDINVYTNNKFSVPIDCPLIFREPVYASEVIHTYGKHPLVVDARADFGLDEIRFARDTSNMRIFEATRAGSLLLTEYAPNLEELFEIGSEIVCYKSDEELIDLVRFFGSTQGSSHSARIALAGFKRVIRSHSIELRALEFSSMLDEML